MKRETASSIRGLPLHLGKGELWALVAALTYALNNIFVRAAIRDYDVNDWMGVTLRAAPTFLFTLVMGLRVRQRNPQAVSPASNWRLVAMLVGYGLLTFVIANPLLFAALRAGGVLVATPVTGTQAIWAGLIAALFLHERLNRPMLGGMMIAVLGIALLAVGQTGGAPISPTWWLAVPFALGTALCWALSGVLVTNAMRQGVDRFRALSVATGSGIAALALLLLFTGDIDVYATTPLGAQIGLLLAGLLNAVALVSVTTALSLTSVASASTLNSLQIGLAPLFAWLFLGERPGWLMAAGILLVASGVVFVQRAKSNADERPRTREKISSTI
jgi:drug/metabolite transporter (DMT)-like permease